MNQHPLEGNLGFHAYQLARLYRQFFSRVTREIHPRLFPEHWIILNQLSTAPAVEQKALLSPHAEGMAGLTRTLAAMERRGWIKRKRDKKDRRRTNVNLTQKGRAIFDQIHEVARLTRPTIYAGVKPMEHNTAVRVMMLLAQNLIRAAEKLRT